MHWNHSCGHSPESPEVSLAALGRLCLSQRVSDWLTRLCPRTERHAWEDFPIPVALEYSFLWHAPVIPALHEAGKHTHSKPGTKKLKETNPENGKEMAGRLTARLSDSCVPTPHNIRLYASFLVNSEDSVNSWELRSVFPSSSSAPSQGSHVCGPCLAVIGLFWIHDLLLLLLMLLLNS